MTRKELEHEIRILDSIIKKGTKIREDKDKKIKKLKEENKKLKNIIKKSKKRNES